MRIFNIFDDVTKTTVRNPRKVGSTSKVDSWSASGIGHIEATTKDPFKSSMINYARSLDFANISINGKDKNYKHVMNEAKTKDGAIAIDKKLRSAEFDINIGGLVNNASETWDGGIGVITILSWDYEGNDGNSAVFHSKGPKFFCGKSNSPPANSIKYSFMVAQDGFMRVTTLDHRSLGYNRPALFAGEVIFSEGGYVESWGNQSGTYQISLPNVALQKIPIKLMPFPKLKYGLSDQTRTFGPDPLTFTNKLP